MRWTFPPKEQLLVLCSKMPIWCVRSIRLMLDVVDSDGVACTIYETDTFPGYVVQCKILHTRKESENEGTQWLGEKTARIHRRTRREKNALLLFFLRSRNTTTVYRYFFFLYEKKTIPFARTRLFILFSFLAGCVCVYECCWCCCFSSYEKNKTTKLCINYCHTYRKSRNIAASQREKPRERENGKMHHMFCVYFEYVVFFCLLSISVLHSLHGCVCASVCLSLSLSHSG